MKYLEPLKVEPHYYEQIEKEVNAIFADLLYRRLFVDLKIPMKELQNAVGNQLYDAMVKGRIDYTDGYFTGDFNARLSGAVKRLGAVYNKTKGAWYLPHSLFPAELQIAQAHADSRYSALADSVFKTLDAVDYKEAQQAALINPTYEKVINDMNAAFYETVKGVAIPPQLTIANRQMIAKNWGDNMNLYIQTWAEKNIKELRTKVQDNAFAGNRAANLANIIRENYGVSQRKAKFLARQETSLLMATFKETRYADVGIRKYKWGGSNDARERHDHNLLNGKIYSFDDPPITNRETGARNNPGEDFGCRCVAIPIIE